MVGSRRASLLLGRRRSTWLSVATALCLAASAGVTNEASAAAPAPPFTQCPAIGEDTGCGLLIYATPSGQEGVAGDPTQGPYDGSDDTLIGVQNESSAPISSIPIVSPTGEPVFGFDGDGICSGDYGAWTGSSGCPYGSTGYEGPGVSFTSISPDQSAGTVVITPAIPPGGHAYFSLEEALPTVPPYGIEPGSTYDALGDSFSAGEGDQPYFPNTDSATNKCHRSDDAYSQLVDGLAGLGPVTFVACSGAITDDLFHENNEHNLQPDGAPEPAQMCGAAAAEPCPSGVTPWLDSSTQNVTLTIGGNDAGFVEVLEHCVKVAYGPFSQGSGNCLTDIQLNNKVLARIDALAGGGLGFPVPSHTTTPEGHPIHTISSVLAAIHQAAPNAHVYLAGYPTLFPANPKFGNCKVGTLRIYDPPAFPPFAGGNKDAIISYPDQRELNLTTYILDRVLHNATKAAGSWATYVDPEPEFTGHHFCDSDELWFNELYAEVDGKTHATRNEFLGSFHPTYGGQVGYADAFLAAGI
ncbi:MAG TPA: SGNH/GDSL hydrolase family protein [Solirubrobacteraceae bacterium]|nr:SGNH/GDSL hydrolase family protein [Solirubrobacteraceae bacterium]